MKKILLAAGIGIGLFINITHANQVVSLNNKTRFAPITWISNQSSDMITIQHGANEYSIYSVQIFVNKTNNYNFNEKTAGVNISNCGKVTHIAPGSSAICQLSQLNPTISFSSDSDSISANGTYQVE